MSKWYEPKLEDIDLDDKEEEIHIWIDSDDMGNIYAAVKVKDIEEVLKTRKK